ncbi:flagellar hook-basal body complex protein [Desulfovibrio sp. OttesenSCG-928-G15]|nr:flagellar hook-basal body complex protein [Desulfovibrio sp. OttesenSCG-928-G15]
MSLTASLWTSVSGLLAHGEKMNVVGNNISNVNTVGFKSQRMDFQDFVYQYIGTAAGMGQVGRGTSIGIVMNDYSQGSLETTTSATDIAISGNGFFSVKPKNNDMNYYTRAGNFTFDKEGYLVDPHGYVLQGWAIDREYATGNNVRTKTGIIGSGAPVDIKLDSFTCPPRHTTTASFPLNLANAQDPTEDDNSTDAANPFFALLNQWDATGNNGTQPLGTNQYAYQSTMEVYDEAGRMHKLTIYFDRVTNSDSTQKVDDMDGGKSYWEYIVTMDPAEDVRHFGPEDVPGTPNVPDNLKGLLGAGTLTFNSDGAMSNMTAYVPHGTDGGWKEDHNNPLDPTEVTGHSIDLTKWVAAPIDTNGQPLFAPNFTGVMNQQQAYDGAVHTDTNKPNHKAKDRLVALDFGMHTTTGSWNIDSTDPANTMPQTAAGITTGAKKTQGFTADSGKVDYISSTCYGDNFYEHSGKVQNGYTYGDLRYVNVSGDGVLTASYSNGVSLQLYQLTLHDFPSPQNLRREGGNLFSETRESGVHSSGAAGTGTFGTTQGYSLEQSNVDLSREFVNMITTQRGFQANSKGITTVDTMLETVINMKR